MYKICERCSLLNYADPLDTSIFQYITILFRGCQKNIKQKKKIQIFEYKTHTNTYIS